MDGVLPTLRASINIRFPTSVLALTRVQVDVLAYRLDVLCSLAGVVDMANFPPFSNIAYLYNYIQIHKYIGSYMYVLTHYVVVLAHGDPCQGPRPGQYCETSIE